AVAAEVARVAPQVPVRIEVLGGEEVDRQRLHALRHGAVDRGTGDHHALLRHCTGRAGRRKWRAGRWSATAGTTTTANALRDRPDGVGLTLPQRGGTLLGSLGLLRGGCTQLAGPGRRRGDVGREIKLH